MPERSRVAVFAPYRGDAAVVSGLAQSAGAEPVFCRNADELREELERGVGAVILSEEACTAGACATLSRAWRDEPSWSSPVVIALVGRLRRPPEPLDRLLREVPSISCLKLQRPLGKEMLISAIRNQLEFRDRQLQIRDLLQEAEAREERQRFLHRELDHRVKNILASLNGLLTLTAAGASDVNSFVRAFQGRVSALSRVHERLSDRVWDRVPLRNLVADALKPYIADDGQVSIDGPEVLVGQRPAVSLTMAFHELATNASKYGSLSTAAGGVSVEWALEPRAGDENGDLRLDWREHGGPPLTEPERKGFGTRLLRQVVEYDLRGTVETAFHTEGLHARLRAPLRETDPPGI